MPLKKIETPISVVDAAKQRIQNIFDSGVNVLLSFSAGKDSLCLSSLTYDLIREGKINPKQLVVCFYDEELIYQDMVDAAMRWKKNFESVGVKFLWFCLPVKQTSVIDSLSMNESWITWDPSCRHLWTRQPPDFAIVQSEYLHYAGEMNYQTFTRKAFKNFVILMGIRGAESYARIFAIATSKVEQNKAAYPIYDWKDTDVWRYIRDRNLEFPNVYMKIYELGESKNRLRLCNFFGEGSSAGLPIVSEIDPDEWDKICKREPNAKLALLYWDSEMFSRKTSTRRELENTDKLEQERDYKALLEDLLFFNTEKYNLGKDTLVNIPYHRKLFINNYHIPISNKEYKRWFEWLQFGDPKRKALRTIPISQLKLYVDMARKEDYERKSN